MTTPASLAFSRHDHSGCCQTALDEADRRVRESGLRLTPVRRRALEILLETHQALGAYDVLERLAEDGFGNQPPVAYRALEFLVAQGLAHRVRRLNAFTACLYPDTDHMPAFFICDTCDRVAEAPVPKLEKAIAEAGRHIGFSVDRLNIEATGLCPGCQAST